MRVIPDMDSGKTITEREGAHTGTEDYRPTGDGIRSQSSAASRDAGKNKAQMNDKQHNLKTERTRPTGEPSMLPGAEEENKVKNVAAGAGLGGNKGRGTSSNRAKDKIKVVNSSTG